MENIQFVAVIDFKHGKESYQKGQTYSLPAKEAYYLMGVGWACEPGEEPAELQGGDATLSIHNSTVGVSDNHG